VSGGVDSTVCTALLSKVSYFCTEMIVFESKKDVFPHASFSNGGFLLFNCKEVQI
jgi:hypothetical protein